MSTKAHGVNHRLEWYAWSPWKNNKFWKRLLLFFLLIGIILYAPQIPEDQYTHGCRKVIGMEGDSSLFGVFSSGGFWHWRCWICGLWYYSVIYLGCIELCNVPSKVSVSMPHPTFPLWNLFVKVLHLKYMLNCDYVNLSANYQASLVMPHEPML